MVTDLPNTFVEFAVTPNTRFAPIKLIGWINIIVIDDNAITIYHLSLQGLNSSYPMRFSN